MSHVAHSIPKALKSTMSSSSSSSPQPNHNSKASHNNVSNNHDNNQENEEEPSLVSSLAKTYGIPEAILLNTALIHRVLQTDPVDWHSLTTLHESSMLSSFDDEEEKEVIQRRATPSFHDFEQDLKNAVSCTDSPSPHDDSPLTTTRTSTTTPWTTTRTSINSLTVGSVATVIRRAYVDQVCRQVQERQREQQHQEQEQPRQQPPVSDTVSSPLEPIATLLLELHAEIRALVPSRRDLHGILDDDQVRHTLLEQQSSSSSSSSSYSSYQQLLALVVHAAQALGQLESEARAESTLEWIRLASTTSTTLSEQQPQQQDDSTRRIRFLVTSILYLLTKAELCARDKQDFYLSHVWAPILARIGPQLERQAFVQHFGPFAHSTTAPSTRAWMNSIRNDSTTTTCTTREEPRTRIQRSWIQDIVFRDPALGSMDWPEVLYLDVPAVHQIRSSVRVYVAASSLVLYARPAAVAVDDDEPSLLLEEKRSQLVQALKARYPFGSDDPNTASATTDYETTVCQAVVELAQCWRRQPSDGLLSSNQMDALNHRTQRVLAADDGVVDLFSQRVKECWTELMIAPTASSSTGSTSTNHHAPGWMTAPPQLVSGHGNPSLSRSNHHKRQYGKRATFVAHATHVLARHGLPWFAKELTEAAWKAHQIIAVALDLYYEVLLEPCLLHQPPQDDHQQQD